LSVTRGRCYRNYLSYRRGSIDAARPESTALPLVADDCDEQALRASATKAFFSAMNLITSFTAWGSLPFVVMHSSLAAIPAIGLAILMSLITALQLGRVLEKVKNEGNARPTFGTVGQAALGPKAYLLTSILALIDSSTFVTLNYAMIGINAPLVLPRLPGRAAILVAALLTGVLNFVPGRIYAYFDATAALTTISIALLLVVTGVMLPEPSETPPQWVPSGHVPQNLWAALMYGLFTVSAHAFHPLIFNAVPDRRTFERAIISQHIVHFTLIAAFTVAALWFFGSSIQPVASTNIGRDLYLRPIAGLEWMGATAGLLIVIKSFLTQKVAIQPVLAFVYEYFEVGKASPSRKVIPCAGHLLSAALACVWVDAIVQADTLIAACMHSSISFIIPPLCYMALMRPGPLEMVVSSAILLTGSGMFAGGVATVLLKAAAVVGV